MYRHHNDTRKYVISSFVALMMLVSSCNLVASKHKIAASQTADTGVPRVTSVTQIIPADRLEIYRRVLPRVAYERINEIFRDPNTFWYDHQAMTPSYQDSVGDGRNTPIGARFNSKGKSVIVPDGKKVFSADGRTFAFPFAQTAGTDNSDNFIVVNFVNLPVVDGAILPVTYWKLQDPRALGTLGLSQWGWIFPKGTTIGEMIFIKDSAGALYPSELRVRTRYAKGWATNSFRPFINAAQLSAAIKQRRADWQSRSNLRNVVEHLENSNTLQPRNFNSPAFGNIFVQNGYVDVLPDFADEALVKELLTETTYVSAYGETWKANGSAETFAPGSSTGFSIAPRNNHSGVIEVNDVSCARCHKDAGRPIADFAPGAILYGDIWGSDQIFSFHPWDETQFSNFNYENRRVRPELAGIFVLYDKAVHTQQHYEILPK